MRLPVRVLALGLLAAVLATPALAQAHNPFGVGISEGGGNASGLMGWLLSQQGTFERSIASAVRASKADGSALWLLMGLSFVYGILHAAGPGHGKAVLAAYMVAGRRALRRGIALSFMAALLQALVAIALVAGLSLVFHATAVGMRDAAAIVETLSYVGITLLGAWMVWRKGRAFWALWRERHAAPRFALESRRGTGEPALDHAVFGWSPSKDGVIAINMIEHDVVRTPVPTFRHHALAVAAPMAFTAVEAPRKTSSFACEAAHEHSAACGHCHAPDPATLGADFSWREALSTVAAAGARPCSGAILVLVFGLAQGMFVAGIASTLVMALGTAITTAALASLAVLARSTALRLAGPGSERGLLVGRALEVLAAALVLAVGLSLLFAIGPLQGLA